MATLFLMTLTNRVRVLKHFGPASDHDLKTAVKLMHALNLQVLVLVHPSQR